MVYLSSAAGAGSASISSYFPNRTSVQYGVGKKYSSGGTVSTTSIGMTLTILREAAIASLPRPSWISPAHSMW